MKIGENWDEKWDTTAIKLRKTAILEVCILGSLDAEKVPGLNCSLGIVVSHVQYKEWQVPFVGQFQKYIDTTLP